MTDAAMMSLLVTDHFEDDDSALEVLAPWYRGSFDAFFAGIRLGTATCPGPF